jgi:hypothetical protein
MTLILNDLYGYSTFATSSNRPFVSPFVSLLVSPRSLSFLWNDGIIGGVERHLTSTSSIQKQISVIFNDLSAGRENFKKKCILVNKFIMGLTGFG